MTALKSVLASVLSVFMIFSSGSLTEVEQENIKYQDEHLSYLETEYYDEAYTPCDESKITSFDLESELANGIKFNEVSFIGTHNSYQTKLTGKFSGLYKLFSLLTFGIIESNRGDFNSEPLTDQFEAGIRSIELDVETVVKDGEVSFVVSHIPFVDEGSNCYDLSKALDEIKLWSDNNPGHLPITIIIEPKKGVVPINGYRNFTLSYAEKLDELLRERLGDTLLTPSEMMGNHSSFKEMRQQDDWLKLSETTGRVMVLLHDTTVSSAYIGTDTSIRTQAMFPMVRYSDRDKSYASFVLIREPSDAVRQSETAVKEDKLIVRSIADQYPNFNTSKHEKAFESGVNIISTDFPLKNNPTSDKTLTFDGGYTVSYSLAHQ